MSARAVVVAGNFTEESGYQAGLQFAAAEARPDAIFAANDMMAIGCLLALRDSHVRVPEDMALAGFDDIPIARYISPPLTTVRAQITELGRQSLEELARSIEDRESVRPERHTLSTQLVIRESCGAARQSAR